MLPEAQLWSSASILSVPSNQWESRRRQRVVGLLAFGSLPVETECLTRDHGLYWNTTLWILINVLSVSKYIFLIARILPK